MKIIFLCAIDYKKINFFLNFKEAHERFRASEIQQYVDTVAFCQPACGKKPFIVYGYLSSS